MYTTKCPVSTAENDERSYQSTFLFFLYAEMLSQLGEDFTHAFIKLQKKRKELAMLLNKLTSISNKINIADFIFNNVQVYC